MSELEQLRAENAAMLELLRSAHAIALRKGEGTAWERFAGSIQKLGIGSVTARTYRVLAHETLDAGRDLFTREQVMPLVKALKTVTSQVCSSDPWRRKVDAESTGLDALDHARAIGILPESCINEIGARL